MKRIIALSVLVCFAVPALAQDAPAAKKWKDAAELSYVQTTGNSKTATISAKELFNYDWKKAALELGADGLGSKSNKVVTAEQYNAMEKVSLKFTSRNYAFEKGVWNKDRFAGIKDRYGLGAGVGRRLMDTADDKLACEIGAGYITEKRIGSADQNFGTYSGYAKYIRTLSATANASQDLEYIGNMKDSKGYRMNAETALIASVTTHSSLKAAYDWKYVNSPPTGFKKTDTKTSMTIIVNY